MMKSQAMRKYITIDEIQREYLPMSKKKIRILVKRYLPAKMLGNRIFVERQKLEELLSSTELHQLDLSAEDESLNLSEK